MGIYRRYNGIYHLVLTNSSPWKDPPIFEFGKSTISMGDLMVIYGDLNGGFDRWVNHLFLWVIEKPWRTVSHNQRVVGLAQQKLSSSGMSINPSG